MSNRISEARAVLERAGIDAPVRATGVAGEIATVTGPARLREPLAGLAPELRGLGFRYVALELENGNIPRQNT